MNWFRHLRKKRKEVHLCIQCGKKVEPNIKYPAGNIIPPIITYPIRCYTCREHGKVYHKKWREKRKQKLLSITKTASVDVANSFVTTT